MDRAPIGRSRRRGRRPAPCRPQLREDLHREEQAMTRLDPETFQPAHFRWRFESGVATVTLDRPERKNPLTFESYAELRDMFRTMTHADDVKVVVLTGAGENFCSGGDVQ